MESEKIITDDYEDTTTGIRFLQDIEGRMHCMSCMFKPDGLGGTVNNYNTSYNYLPPSDIYQGLNPVIVQTAMMDINWPNTADFHRVNNTYSGGYVCYTTPIDRELHISTILASQGANTLSMLGLYKAGSLLLTIPFMQEIYINFFRPIIIPPATYTEIKFRPGTKKLSVVLSMIGYLIQP